MILTILVIEDHDQNRYLLQYLLEKHGFEVVAAADGPRGIEMARTRPPDLVLLDIQLPSMNGYEVAQELRRIPQGRDVPIVAVTSYAMKGDREKALAAGCDGHIEKPIDTATFVEQITRHLPPSSRPEEAPESRP